MWSYVVIWVPPLLTSPNLDSHHLTPPLPSLPLTPPPFPPPFPKRKYMNTS